MEVKHKDQCPIPSDILDDLASRFIINVPMTERSDLIRICFQIELAHWFYLDFYCSVENEKLQPCGIKQFAYYIFQHIPFLTVHMPRINDIMNEFKLYKMSVPTYGAILISEDFNNVLLVQSYWSRSSWGFPKGKVNEDEDPLHCAIREVHEETSYDISKLIKSADYIDGVINYQYTRLYIVKNVPISTVFTPRTRKEIKCCEWFKLDHLPTHKTDSICKINLGINPNSFFMILPFIKRLKRWLAEQNKPINELSSKDFNNKSKYQTSETINKRRERQKSTGDLDDNRHSTFCTNVLRSPQFQRKCKDKNNFGNRSQSFKINLDDMVRNDTGTTKSTKEKNLKQKKTNRTNYPLVNLIDLINKDFYIQKWQNFKFAIDKIV